ncbi:unnamed protein product [Tuber melanosporum]|uniref:(Perigord truffle) hypothetical protein n=1 Tax=Tuber melanosporum (strain Mel28) TaxID=656061 RepID=D5G9P9_TUBMM|nr:uncharacterized protein GSTUM_00005014001 [Tuber melanosporum]CAZ81242.1 unnamed protein product [Tuber melanosporum]
MIRGSMFGQEAVFLAMLVIGLHSSPCGLPEPQAEAVLWGSWQQHSFMNPNFRTVIVCAGALRVSGIVNFGWLICREKCEYGWRFHSSRLGGT